MDWDKLKIFYIVAKCESLTRAVEPLGLSQTAISRQISLLEERLDAVLFIRHPRGLKLTEQGEILYRSMHEIFSELTMVELQISNNTSVAQGPLKISTTVGFGSTWLAPRVYKFLKQYPDIPILLKVSDILANLHFNESDIVITSDVVEDKSLKYQKIMTRAFKIYSSQSYMDQFGMPQKMQDLDHHRLVVFGDKVKLPAVDGNWLLQCGNPESVMREPYLLINNLYGIAQAVEEGAGICCIPEYVAAKCSKLIEISLLIEPPQVSFYCVYPKVLSDSKKIAVFLEFLIQEAMEEENNARTS